MMSNSHPTELLIPGDNHREGGAVARPPCLLPTQIQDARCKMNLPIGWSAGENSRLKTENSKLLPVLASLA